MKIWLDSILCSQLSLSHGAPIMQGNLDEGCGCDGHDNGVCNNDMVSLPETGAFTVQNIQQMYGQVFSCASTLYRQPLSDSRWIICTPDGESKLAVLDAEAYRLLERFRTPRMVGEILADEATRLAPHMVDLFIRAGFLQGQDQRSEPVLYAPPREVDDIPQTLSVWLHITNACNLRCSYCYISKTSEHMHDDTTRRSVDAAIRSALAFHYRAIRITFAGGEATLRMPEVIATYDYALEQAQLHGLSFSAHIISNGVALPLRAIEQIKQRQIRLVISLDGVGAAHDQQRPLINGQGSFIFVDRTITRLLKAQLIPYINITVSQRNLHDLPGLLEYVFQRNLPFGLSYYRDNDCSIHPSDLQFTDAQMIKGMRAAFAYIEEHLPQRRLLSGLVDKARTDGPRRYSCGMGRHYMAINQYGGIAKCQMEIGNTVTNIDSPNPLQVIRADRRGIQAVAVDDKEGCRDCEWRYWCSGGCAMLTYRLTGRSDIKSPNCEIYQALFPEAVRLEALRLLKYYEPVRFSQNV